jgi:hypothetical protein
MGAPKGAGVVAAGEGDDGAGDRSRQSGQDRGPGEDAATGGEASAHLARPGASVVAVLSWSGVGVVVAMV